jgi:chromosome segregation protein
MRLSRAVPAVVRATGELRLSGGGVVAIPPQEISVERALVPWPEEVPEGEDAEAASPVDAALGAAPLRIRQVELIGFKSFRDRTVLRFPAGVTGVVGPNGCGKSNVVDAIRWVLGEQSAKRLRGGAMEDVIFGGNDRHAPLGMAQVSIVFESEGLPVEQFALLKESGHPLAGPGPAEIMVTRRYLRSGESEYLMNGAPCRLRDITELFLGTGVGSKAYAIIEQGRVEQLVGAKPDELRLFIEEAAGTTLYRSRRQVAERKMERTQENLLRVRDILREVERQLAGLRRQAKRAEQYRTLQSEIRELDVALAGRQRRRLAAELASLDAVRAETTARSAALTATLEAMENERRSARERESVAQRRLQDAQSASFEARAASDQCRHEAATLEARAGELAAQDAAIERDLATATAEQARANDERTAAEAALVALSASITEIESTLRKRDEVLAAATLALATAERELEETKVVLVDALEAEAQARNAVNALQQRRAEECGRRERLEAESAALVTREHAVLERAAAAEASIREFQTRLERLEGTKRTRAEELRRLLAERTTWDAALDGIKEALARTRSRRDSLRELEDSHAGYGEGVRAVLAASAREEALGLVTEILEIPAEHERAIAAALGEQLQAVVMRDSDAARDAVQALRRAGAGRATCIPRSARRHASDIRTAGRPLLDLVGVRPGYEEVAAALLGHVALVDDLETALEIWSAGDGPALLVTPAGETVDAAGAVAGGNQRAEETLLAERRELRALDTEVERREQDLASARVRQDGLRTAVSDAEATLHDLDTELTQVAVAIVGSEKDVERARQELHDLAAQSTSVAVERDAIAGRLADLESAADELRAVQSAAERGRESAAGRVDDLERRRADTRRVLGDMQEAVTEQRIALAEARARRGALETMIAGLRRTLQDVERRATMLDERRRADQLAAEQVRDALARARASLTGLVADVDARAAHAHEAEAACAAMRAALEAGERAIAETQGHQERVRTELSAGDVQIAEHRLALEHLEETIRERYGADLPLDDPGAADESDAAEERLARLRQRIAGMGDVNVAALSEVAELEERQTFLATQQVDLERALDDLRKTIARLNRTSRTRFRETFERVDATFREVFPKLFQGGKAQLRLTDEDAVLDSGVEIVVQPPGKRIGPLDLLSGGEKALTAVSLIFALFLIKPSPFCFLDEVDAPLDDANISRFNAMVREMSRHSQFILITHNKRTMEVAETLYGITMEEPGVSKVVSVRLPG